MFIFRLYRSVHSLQRALCLGALGLIVLMTSHTVSAQMEHITVQQSVEKFCALDFAGAQDVEQRQRLVYFSDAHVRELGKIMDGLSPYVFEWEVAPLAVVDSYKVDQITVTGDEATASVTYKIVAQRGTWGGAVRRVPTKARIIQLQLRRFGDRWKVIDPPIPRVSRDFLSSSYRGIFELPRSWYQNASPEQLMRLRNAIDTILLLDGLK